MQRRSSPKRSGTVRFRLPLSLTLYGCAILRSDVRRSFQEVPPCERL
jgi:hypothetical protein